MNARPPFSKIAAVSISATYEKRSMPGRPVSQSMTLSRPISTTNT